MTAFSQSGFLKETLTLLVAHFGADKVHATLEKVSPKPAESERVLDLEFGKEKKQDAPRRPSVSITMSSLEKQDPVQYGLLKAFIDRLRARTVLPESEDIRHFAQLVGLKELRGKSRRDLIPSLLEHIVNLPSEQLRGLFDQAEGISEATRRKGYSLLTDKLMRK